MNLLKFDKEAHLAQYENEKNLLGKKGGKKAIGNFYIYFFL